ncbi:hypothetical protein Q4F19_03325 [Sphingomonas sp. BIUV-7]|uniref:Uncharacterized protein n=1 Tax=Sphingomonas natans TaxID=3063330 RepID=A0ABT8Y505_9SPHN|nr:hypothetical protein [Sphingomonas sp. BIUV-7]MDO6413404.1 hypothetical protein [Sphingomonas sp. BIUV-7]
MVMVAALPVAAGAQMTAETTAPSDEIVVTGVKGRWSLEGKRLRAAQAAFVAGQPRYAPGSRLVFQINLKTDRSPDGLVLTLRKGDEIVAVPLDGDRRFTLPLLDSDDWLLSANRTPAEVGVRMWVFSSNSTEFDRRLGDMRLHCRVAWALKRDRASIFQRAAFSTLGGCESASIMFITTATRPLASAEVVSAAGAVRPLEVKDGLQYGMPIGDKSLTDEARVHLVAR